MLRFCVFGSFKEKEDTVELCQIKLKKWNESTLTLKSVQVKKKNTQNTKLQPKNNIQHLSSYDMLKTTKYCHETTKIRCSSRWRCCRWNRQLKVNKWWSINDQIQTVLKSRKGTNWTMSLRTGSPFGERSTPSSPSKICMSVKSAFPTPTMIMERGW